MNDHEENHVEGGLSAEDMKNQDDALKKWTAEVKKIEKTPSIGGEIAGGAVEVAAGIVVGVVARAIEGILDNI